MSHRTLMLLGKVFNGLNMLLLKQLWFLASWKQVTIQMQSHISSRKVWPPLDMCSGNRAVAGGGARARGAATVQGTLVAHTTIVMDPWHVSMESAHNIFDNNSALTCKNIYIYRSSTHVCPYLFCNIFFLFNVEWSNDFKVLEISNHVSIRYVYHYFCTSTLYYNFGCCFLISSSIAI